MPFCVIILSYWNIFYDANLYPSILLCNIISLNCFARSQQHRTSTGTQFPSLKIIINRNFSRMADQSSFSNCKSATPTKPTSSNTIHHANPFTKLIKEINQKSNVEKSWNCSLFCTGYLPNPTAVGPSEQNLVKHMDPTRFLYDFPFQRRSSFMFDPEKFSGLKDTDKITLHLNELCRENGFKMWVPRTCKGGAGDYH